MTDQWIKNELDLYEKTHNIKLNRNNILKVLEKIPEDEQYSLYLKDRDYINLNLTQKEMELIMPLMTRIPITPLTGDNNEWIMVTRGNSSLKFYANKRSINTYKKEFENGITIYYHKFYVENALDLYRSGSRIENREIKFPFIVPFHNEYIYEYIHEFNGLSESVLLTNEETIKKIKSIMKSNIICNE